jgi:hypothetical protein
MVPGALHPAGVHHPSPAAYPAARAALHRKMLDIPEAATPDYVSYQVGTLTRLFVTFCVFRILMNIEKS